MAHLTQNGVQGLVYWQDENLVHIENRWIPFGQTRAGDWEVKMRNYAFLMGDANAWDMERPMCPACYMLAGYNMLVALAQRTGQSLEELGESMAMLFSQLADAAPPNAQEAATFPYRQEMKVFQCTPESCGILPGEPHEADWPASNEPPEDCDHD